MGGQGHARERRGRLFVEQISRTARRHPTSQSTGGYRCGQGRATNPAGLLGRGDEDRIPFGQGTSCPLAAPLDDAALGPPRDDLVDSELGSGLDRLLVATPFGERLDENEPRRRLGDVVDHLGANLQKSGTGSDDGSGNNPSGSVRDSNPGPDPGAAHRDRVPSLLPGDRDHFTRRDVVETTAGREVERQAHDGIPME